MACRELSKKSVSYTHLDVYKRQGWHPAHPTLYLKKHIYQAVGKFDLNYRICSDYDFMLRMMKRQFKLVYIDRVLIHMRSGGVSTNGLTGYMKNFKESYKAVSYTHLDVYKRQAMWSIFKYNYKFTFC